MTGKRCFECGLPHENESGFCGGCTKPVVKRNHSDDKLRVNFSAIPSIAEIEKCPACHRECGNCLDCYFCGYEFG